MTLAKLVADTDATLDKLKATLQASQEAYFKAKVGVDKGGRPILRGKYKTVARGKARGITYAMHEYDGPLGKGWMLHAWVTSGGKTYHRQQDFGKEGRSTPWEVVLS